MDEEKMAMPIPKEAVKVCNYRDAYGTVTFRIITMPENSNSPFIAQDQHSSIGFPTYDAAEKFMFQFNQ